MKFKGMSKNISVQSAQGITHEACDALYQGDAENIGKLMKRAQAEFDKHLQPACPEQLTAPVLHKVLNYGPIQPYILGGKGVGSQGDGTAQFIVKDQTSQQKTIDIIERDLKMSCLKLVIQAGRRVRKAVIPAAGFGTRLFSSIKSDKEGIVPYHRSIWQTEAGYHGNCRRSNQCRHRRGLPLSCRTETENSLNSFSRLPR